MIERSLKLFAVLRDPHLHQTLAALPELTVHTQEVPHDADGRALVAHLADLQPDLIVVELDGDAAWLSQTRSDPATRRLPTLAIGDDQAAAQRAAAVRIPLYPRAVFLKDAAAIIRLHARAAANAQALSEQCAESLSPLVLRGLQEFNRGEYYECHETLEEAWVAESRPIRDLYRAILQVSVAYYHILRGNYNGAHKMFLRSVQWFASLPDQCMGIDIAALRADVLAVRLHLQALGPENIAQFDRSLLKPIRYTSEAAL
jgi:predicted metal-dependent hydrolase